ncbi:protein of unknown function; putative exported protein [Methylorubrum extorquens DM4]|uniref:Uncharacterized protein n=1 Tax=Methylorubrum extorquens (strain DSM 6343 / CIP 106787 / DM4) TaxID=661410 RepID=C7CHK7_METED|nr:protein of unknown function; putative exported protein [Methylorubrum extorquens DM4]
MFTALVGVGVLLFAANVVVAALRLSHRPTQARIVVHRLSPLASYLRLGGSTRSQRERSKHA